MVVVVVVIVVGLRYTLVISGFMKKCEPEMDECFPLLAKVVKVKDGVEG